MQWIAKSDRTLWLAAATGTERASAQEALIRQRS